MKRREVLRSLGSASAVGLCLNEGPLLAEHRADLERMGWTVQMVDGFGHDLGGRPDVVLPILRVFLDPVLLR